MTELTQILGQSQPRISRHLKLLCEAGLVERYREGSWVYFRLSDGVDGDIAREIISFVPNDDTDYVKDADRYTQVRQKSALLADAYFTKNAANWDQIRSLHIDEADVEKAILGMLADYQFKHLIDLGTGTGRMLEVLSDKYDTALGLDANIDMLGYARARLESLGITHTQLRQGDILNLSVDKGSADGVIIHQVLHYLDEPRLAFEEASRICRSGGLLLIVDFESHDLEFLRNQHAHKRLGFSDEKINEWAKKYKLDVIENRKLKKEKSDDGKSLTVGLWLLEKK